MKILKNAAMILMLVLAFSCLKSPRSDSANEVGIESLIKEMLADSTYKGIYIEKDAINMVVKTDNLVESLLSYRYTDTDFLQYHLRALKPPEDFTKLFENVCSEFSNVHLIKSYMKDIYSHQDFDEDNVVEDFSSQLLVVRPIKPVVLTNSNKLLLVFQVNKAWFLRDPTTGKFVAYSPDIEQGIGDFWFVLVEMKDGRKQSIKIWKNGMILNGS